MKTERNLTVMVMVFALGLGFTGLRSAYAYSTDMGETTAPASDLNPMAVSPDTVALVTCNLILDEEKCTDVETCEWKYDSNHDQYGCFRKVDAVSL